MSRADTQTLLSLDRFARIMGINPVHFNGAAGEIIFPGGGACSDIWFQQSYIGADRVSRDDLAQEIATAERDVAQYLGYWPAPKFISREMHMFPRHYRPEGFGRGYNVRGDAKSLKLKWGRFISAGRRHVQVVGQASTGAGTLVWSDPDGDTLNELATITLPTTLTSLSRQQVKVYFDGHHEPEWEVRPVRSVEITGGVLTIEIDFWQLIDPEQQAPFPTTAGNAALDIADPTIYVDTVDVYREYADYSEHSAEFFWEPRQGGSAFSCPSCGGNGCAACQETVQCGCLHVRDVMTGIAVPTPAAWDGSAWAASSFSLCYAPDQVLAWYYAGEMSEGFLAGDDLDPLALWFAEAIAWMAVARLERNFCNCGNLVAMQTQLRADMSRTDSGGPSWFLTERDSENPFGTRVGEVKAWRRLSKLAPRISHVAVV